MNQREIDVLHDAPSGVASTLFNLGRGPTILFFMLLCVVGLGAFGFTKFMENKGEIVPAIFLILGLLLAHLFCGQMKAGGASTAKACSTQIVLSAVWVLIIEMTTASVGNYVARATTVNPFVALQNATGLAVGPFAREAARTRPYQHYGRTACLAAKADGRFLDGNMLHEGMSDACRLIIGTGHMYTYCAKRYNAHYDSDVTTYNGGNYDNGTACGPYLKRYYWQRGEYAQ